MPYEAALVMAALELTDNGKYCLREAARLIE
jgi:hypothetical protein